MEDSVDGYWTFLTQVLGYRDLDTHLHGDICDILAKQDAHKYLFLLPRGHLKSSCVTIGYPMWRACQDPNRTFAIYNETEDLPLEFIREIRTHCEDNPIMKKFWGNLVPKGDEVKVWRSDGLQFVREKISRTPTFAASSIGKATAGRHPDCMILDDVVSDRTVGSESAIQKSLARFKELQALLEPPDAAKDPLLGTMIVIGTRWHWNDLYSHIIDHLSNRYMIMKRSAVENGKIIFPQKFSFDYLEELKETMGEWVFSSQYMNEPVDSENATFTPTLLKKATWRESRNAFLANVPTSIYMAVDPAFEGHDSWGITVGCMDTGGYLRVLAAERCRKNPVEAINKIVGMCMAWGVQKVGFENPGGQEWLRKELQKALTEAEIHISVEGISHQNKNKDTRILSMVPLLNAGKLRIHEKNDELRNELLQYPRGKFRDLADSLEMLTRIAHRPGLAPVRKKAQDSIGTGDWEIEQLLRKPSTKRMGGPW
jgi:hypothetical protein